MEATEFNINNQRFPGLKMLSESKLKEPMYFPNLDGFRFVAFFLVFLAHGFYETIPSQTQNIFLRILKNGILSGGLGPSFFFVLSGFLITYLILNEIEKKGKLNLFNFYMRRTLRIWPLYFAVIGFVYFLYPFIKSLAGLENSSIQNINPTYYLLFLSNFQVINSYVHHLPHTLMLDITWTVAINEQFYIFWPLLLLLFRRKFYSVLFVILLFISLFYKIYNHQNTLLLYYHTLSNMFELVLGSVVGYLSYTQHNLIRSIKDLGRDKIILIYFVGICYLILNGSQYIFNDLRIVLPFFFAFIIVEQNYGEYSFYKMAGIKPIDRLGKYSYGMYLLHPIALSFSYVILRLSGMDILKPLTMIVAAISGFFITIVISYLSYHFFEKRFLALKKYFGKKKNTEEMEENYSVNG